MLKFEFKSDEILDYSVAHNSTEMQIKYIFNSYQYLQITQNFLLVSKMTWAPF